MGRRKGQVMGKEGQAVVGRREADETKGEKGTEDERRKKGGIERNGQGIKGKEWGVVGKRKGQGMCELEMGGKGAGGKRRKGMQRSVG